MWTWEAGIARTGHTRLPSAARGAQLPAFQGSLVWGNHLTVLTKRLQASAPRRLGASGTDGRCVAGLVLDSSWACSSESARRSRRWPSRPRERHTRSRRRQLPTEPRHDARPNKPGPHRRPAARHDAAPETFPRTTPFDVGARSPGALEATRASPSAPGHPDLSRGRLRLVDAIRQDVREGRPKAALFVLLRRAQNATRCQCRRAGRRSSRPGCR